MLGFIRLAVFGFIFLSVIYIIVSLWSRYTRAGKLRKAWEEEGRPGDRDTYVREGLKEYDSSFRAYLTLLVYIVPITLIAVTIYFVNFH